MAICLQKGGGGGEREEGGGLELLKYLRHYVRNLLKVNLTQSHLSDLPEIAILRAICLCTINKYMIQKRKFQFYSV